MDSARVLVIKVFGINRFFEASLSVWGFEWLQLHDVIGWPGLHSCSFNHCYASECKS